MSAFSSGRSPKPANRARVVASSALALGLLLTLAACRSEQERAFEAELATLGRAIDSLRDAPNAGKAPLLEALKTSRCHDPRACELKSRCIRAYMTQRSGLEASARAAALLGNADPAAALAAAAELQRAEANLLEAKHLGDECATAQGELLRASRARR